MLIHNTFTPFISQFVYLIHTFLLFLHGSCTFVTYRAREHVRPSSVYGGTIKFKGNINFIVNANEARVSYEVPIKSGHLYLFSSSLLHFVPWNLSGQNRVSISGNLIPNPQFVEVIKDDDDYIINSYFY